MTGNVPPEYLKPPPTQPTPIQAQFQFSQIVDLYITLRNQPGEHSATLKQTIARLELIIKSFVYCFIIPIPPAQDILQ